MTYRTNLALALSLFLALYATGTAASAQQPLGSVVCVASELESLAGSGPVRRVIRRDTALVYRVGVGLSSQDEVERGLRTELGAAGEIWGETTWYQNDEVSETDVGLRQGGLSEGFWVISDPDGSRSEGSFVDGLRHGVWTYFDENGRELGTITWDNVRRVGG